jgi:hypothetical protein
VEGLYRVTGRKVEVVGQSESRDGVKVRVSRESPVESPGFDVNWIRVVRMCDQGKDILRCIKFRNYLTSYAITSL